MPIQWIIVVFATFAIVQAWRAFVGGSLDRRKLLLWSVFWVVVASVVLLPQVTSVMAAWLGVGRGVDLVLYLSVALLFYALFQNSRKIDRLERSLTELVRELAIREARAPQVKPSEHGEQP